MDVYIHRLAGLVGLLFGVNVCGVGCGSISDDDATDAADASDAAVSVEEEAPDGPIGTLDPTPCDNEIPASECDDSKQPIVFIHGTFGSATEISKTALRFGSNGYCQDRFVAVEYNSLGGSPGEQLAALVDEVLERTGFEQVDLIAHSQGTGHACTYLGNEVNRAKVARYINVSGGCAGAGIPTLSLSSTNDLNAPEPSHAAGDNVTQVTLTEEDHVALAGSELAFVEMYRFLMEEEPEYTTVQCGSETVVLDGKAVTFADNEPNAGAILDVFEVDTLDEPWERGEPITTVVADENGHVHVELTRGVQYEFRGRDEAGVVSGYIYYAPFTRSDYLMRFISESDSPLITSISTDNVVRAPDHMGLVGRYRGGAFRADWNNSLTFDGEEVLTEDNAGRNASVVGLFMYDANLNGDSDLGMVDNTSFLYMTDVVVDSTTPRWVDVQWTNEDMDTVQLRIPNWPSSENLTSLVLP